MVIAWPPGLVTGTVMMKIITRNVSLMVETAARILLMLWKAGTCTAQSVNAWRTILVRIIFQKRSARERSQKASVTNPRSWTSAPRLVDCVNAGIGNN